MDLTAAHLLAHPKWAIAYHPDGDGFGTVNIFMNQFPKGSFRLYSIDSPKRDFTEAQLAELFADIDAGYQVIYLDLTPSNIPQLTAITDKVTLYYIDHHQISPAYAALFSKVYVHNPNLFAPARAHAYAAGMQVYQLFGEQQADLPYLLISLFGDAKFNHWPALSEALAPHQKRLAAIADALSSVGLTKPVGPYHPARNDALFSDVINRVRRGYQERGIEGLFAGFDASDLATEYAHLKRQIERHFAQVKQAILEEKRAILIENDDYILSPILLKEAYKQLDFQGPYVLYQHNPPMQLVHYAIMSKNSDYDCAKMIRETPFAAGGGHKDRGGCTGPADALQQALDFFLSPST